MKKLYSIVLMAAALLIGTNVKADEVTVGTSGAQYTDLQTAIDEAPAGGSRTIKLTTPLTFTAGNGASQAFIWVGTETESGAAKSITLDLQGNNITFNAGDYKNSKNVQTAQILYPFVLSKGELVVTSAAEAHIYVAAGVSAVAAGTNVFSVYGTYNKVNPKTNAFSHLEIDANVNVHTVNGTVIAVDRIGRSQGSKAPYTVTGYAGAYGAVITDFPNKGYVTDFFSDGYGFAFGVLVDVKGKLYSDGGTKCYGVKTNGLLAYPGVDYTTADKKKTARPAASDASYPKRYFDATAQYESWMSSYSVSASDKDCAPFIHIHAGAELNTDNGHLDDASAAAYASGYANWLIEGKCDGATGLYASSGDIDIQSAIITSHATEYSVPAGTGHADGVGSAIVINSRDAYAGAISVDISGDTEVEATSGFAIEECVKTSDDETKVESITINAGSFQGGTNPATGESQPAIIVSAQTSNNSEADVVVYGGNIEGPLVVNGDDSKSLDDFLDGDVHTTTVIVDGNMTTVVSAGDAPDKYATIVGNAGKSVYWSGDSETLTADIILAELEINKMDTTWNSGHTKITAITPHAQVLYVGDADHNVTLKVGRVVLGEAAQIIVNAGSKLIVDGEQGFVAPVAENIILRASQDAQANFLFHPNVTSNRHPSATVEFVSKSWRLSDGSAMAWQRFGIPSFGALTEITATAPTAFARFNKETNEWESIGILGTMDLNQMAKPFEYYQMLNNTPDMGTVVTMKGQLLGNDSPELAILGNFWNGFANSYMAPISGAELLKLIPNTVDKAFYLNKISGDQATWESVTNMNIIMGLMDDIKPMQPFLIRNTLAAADVTVDYAKAVYNPALGLPNAAPARNHSSNDVTYAKISVLGADGVDRILVAEGDDFSAEFDNGYDAAKYMNDGINLYVSADEKMSNFATDNLNNTYVGFQTVNGGNYTIEFANVQGAELTLIDHETDARVAMVEGNTYEFTAAANSVNDYRFEIVESAKLPTAIENTEAVKSAKGVYTITGQYVGEMNVWNTLPAGIYVVNGEKRVK